MLNNMGANIEWLDEKTLLVEQVQKLSATEHSDYDRIIGATSRAATGLTRNTYK
ncbi:MAG: hypothetical protein U5K84_06350 [Alkalibacterium sp.]|nr:hypothetical protein [Alkalibacterium sp.]